MDDSKVVETVVSALREAGFTITELMVDELEFGDFDIITFSDWFCFSIRNGSLYQDDFSGSEFISALNCDLHSAILTRYSVTA